MKHDKRELSVSPEKAMILVKAEANRIRGILEKSCPPGWYEALDIALQKYLTEELQVLRLIANSNKGLKQ